MTRGKKAEKVTRKCILTLNRMINSAQTCRLLASSRGVQGLHCEVQHFYPSVEPLGSHKSCGKLSRGRAYERNERSKEGMPRGTQTRRGTEKENY